MSVFNTYTGTNVYSSQIQKDIISSNVSINCDPQLRGPNVEESSPGILSVEQALCDLAVSGDLTVKGASEICQISCPEFSLVVKNKIVLKADDELLLESGTVKFVESHIETFQKTKPTILVGTPAPLQEDSNVIVITNSTDISGGFQFLNSYGQIFANTLVRVVFNRQYSNTDHQVFISAKTAAAAEAIKNGYFITSSLSNFLVTFTGGSSGLTDAAFNYFVISTSTQ